MALNNIDKKLIEEFEKLEPDFWDFKNEDTRCFTHGIHGYPAIMVAPVSRNLLSLTKKYVPVNSLMDPFMGSGSVLIEGMVAGINTIIGSDLNPLASLISKVRTTPLSDNQISLIDNFKIVLEKEFLKHKDNIDLFEKFVINEKQLDITGKTGWGYDTKEIIDEFKNKYKCEFNFPDFTNIGFWFQPRAIYELQLIKNVINKSRDRDIKDFLKITFSETIRKVSNAKNGEFKLVRKKNEQILKTKIDALKEFENLLKRNISKMIDFNNVLKQNNSNSEVNLYSLDTRNLSDCKRIKDNSIDLVITSPPYGDSQTTVAYGQYSRLSLQWLDLKDENNINIASLDKSLLGGKPYRDKSQWEFLGSKTLTQSLKQIADADPFRADDVFSFYIDLDKCIYGINKKMKSGSYQFWVVGNRTVKNINLKTDVIISEMAKKYGIEYVYTVNRNIINKVMPSLNSPTNIVGRLVRTMTKENIVVLRKL